MLALVLLAAVAVARTCGRHEQEISQTEAVEIAKAEAAFTPCAQPGCVVVRAVQQGIPPRLVWIVGLAERLGEDGKPTRTESFVVDAATGAVRRQR